MDFQYKALVSHNDYLEHFGAKAPKLTGAPEVTPKEQGVFIRRHPNADLEGDSVPQRQALLGRFGIPTPWSQDEEVVYKPMVFAPSESVSDSKGFSALWCKGQRCIIPAGSYDKVMFYQRRKSEIKRVSKDPFGPLGIAGLWCEWVNGEGISKFSYALLSTSTGKHPLMQHFQYKGVASRMPLILPEDEYETWLNGTPQENKNLLLNCPAAELKVSPPFQAYLVHQL